MKSLSSFRVLALLAVAMVMTFASVAEAQIRVGNQIRRQLPGGNREAQPAQQQAEATPAAARNQITPELLDRFEVALGNEIGAIEARNRREASRETDRQKYSNCMMEFVQSKEYEQIMERMAAAAERNDNAAAQKAMEDQVAAMEKKCGPNPESSSSYESPRERERKAAADAQLSESHYFMLKERVPPLCRLNPSDDADNLRVQNAGVFTNEEIRAIKPRCATLMERVNRLS